MAVLRDLPEEWSLVSMLGSVALVVLLSVLFTGAGQRHPRQRPVGRCGGLRHLLLLAFLYASLRLLVLIVGHLPVPESLPIFLAAGQPLAVIPA